MRDTNVIEKEQQRDYPGLTVRRDRGAVVVHVPVRYHRRNGRQMLLTPEDHQWAPERAANQTLVEALAKAHRWQARPAQPPGGAGSRSSQATTPPSRIWPNPWALIAPTSVGPVRRSLREGGCCV